LGSAYHYGKGVPQDNEQAVYWWRKAAEQEVPEAQFAMGLASYYGWHMSKDEERAFEWWRKAAAQGNAYAKKLLKEYNLFL